MAVSRRQSSVLLTVINGKFVACRVPAAGDVKFWAALAFQRLQTDQNGSGFPLWSCQPPSTAFHSAAGFLRLPSWMSADAEPTLTE